ncbi:MAG: bifunctional phosphoribosylaminoimidazolecarboxamide formyltransferase/IMP cyclohydrolase [Campylobacterales bacterium]
MSKKYALLSVSNKNGIVEFAKGLVDNNYSLISTGGTAKLLEDSGLEVIKVSDITGFPELFDGRVKTLHPLIHGGLLFRRNNKQDREDAKTHNIPNIEVVAINLYPFKETVKNTEDFDSIIENIDIGGPAMVRASAKNFRDVTILTNPDDYELFLQKLKTDKLNINFRRDMMIKAYSHTASYDAFIANYMNERFNEGSGESFFVEAKKARDLRYGENPHQKGSLYEFGDFYKNSLIPIKNEPSFNNYNDINAALKLATSFKDKPVVSIIKHANPCGFAIKDNLLTSFQHALICDPLSAYGGVCAINGEVDEELAKEISKIYIEVIVAASFSDEALKVFESKKRLKLFTQNSKHLFMPKDEIDFKHIEGGILIQSSDEIEVDEVKKSKCVSKTIAKDSEFEDLEIAYKIAAITKSNCVTVVKDGVLLAIGMGMTSRVDAASCAFKKASNQDISLEGATLASEAFFPFRDSIDVAASEGISLIIEPGGSMRDGEVIEAANEHGIALYFSGKRHFLH